MAKSKKDDTIATSECENNVTPEQSGDDEVKEGATAAQAEEVAGADDVSAAADGAAEEVAADEADAAAETSGEDAINEMEELLKAKAEAADWQDKYMRLHAEWDTYRRRMKEQQAEEKARAAEKLMEDLLPVIDDFERTIDYANKNGETGLLGGVEAVRNKFVDMLSKHGLETIDPAGQAFNALEAQAVATVENAEEYDETVADVYQKGYRLGTKVLRSAMVTVTTGGKPRPAEEAEAEEANDAE